MNSIYIILTHHRKKWLTHAKTDYFPVEAKIQEYKESHKKRAKDLKEQTKKKEIMAKGEELKIQGESRSSYVNESKEGTPAKNSSAFFQNSNAVDSYIGSTGEVRDGAARKQISEAHNNDPDLRKIRNIKTLLNVENQ